MFLNRIVFVNCERTAPGLFNEPFNVMTGLTFLIAAGLLFRNFKKQEQQPFSILFLIIMVALVGIGSSVFHSTARMWAALFADALPIVIFAMAFIFMFSRHVLRLKTKGALGMIFLFIAANIIFKLLVYHAPDGFISVMPTMFYMIYIALYMMWARHEDRIRFGLATIIACIATAFRILDWIVCDYFAPGTHFVWHSLMAVFMYMAVDMVMRRYRKNVT